MLLSVIIPFYQVQAYIGACLERICRLPQEACEVLLVDDCGRDASASIAAEYCRRHANFRLIRREANGGLSAARNTGMGQARGEYVCFVDSDDLPNPDALYALARDAQASRLDVAKARFRYFDDETGRQTDGPAIPATGVMTGGALFAAQCRAGLYEPMVWQCVFRRAFLEENGLTMAEGLLFEDELFQAPALLCASRAAASERVILLYRQRAGSIMASFAKSARWCESYLQVCRRLSALSADLPRGEARRALQKRTGQIALSVAKNIPAYRLPEAVAAQARAFLREHRRELASYAVRSGSAAVAAQGLALCASPGLFISGYAGLARLAGRGA